MELGPEAWPTIIFFAILAFVSVLGVLALVVAGLAHGLKALQTTREHPNRPSLRLAALNLFEPSLTVTWTLTALLLLSRISQLSLFIWSLLLWILQSLMLLAPLFAPATLPFRNTIAIWGSLRWINTVLLLIVIALSFLLSNSGLQYVALIFVVSGVVLVLLSIREIVPIVRKLLIVKKVLADP